MEEQIKAIAKGFIDVGAILILSLASLTTLFIIGSALLK